MSPNPTLITPPPRPSVIMSSQSEVEVAGEMVNEEELSLEGESDEDPVVQPKPAPVAPVTEVAAAQSQVSRNTCSSSCRVTCCLQVIELSIHCPVQRVTTTLPVCV